MNTKKTINDWLTQLQESNSWLYETFLSFILNNKVWMFTEVTKNDVLTVVLKELQKNGDKISSSDFVKLAWALEI